MSPEIRPEARPETVVRQALATLADGRALGEAGTTALVGALMDEAATPAQLGAVLMGLTVDRITSAELIGAARAMRVRALPLPGGPWPHAVDTCGTGGDGAGTVNLSTLAALIVAAVGVPVAKHGNRAQSSRAGSADVLEALGVVIDQPPVQVEADLTRTGLGFLYAPRFHAATRAVAGARRELGVRTVFNLLGPLTNPAGVQAQVVGVFAAPWCAPMAMALGALGARRAYVVHGHGQLDEVAVDGATAIASWADGQVTMQTVTPRAFGLDPVDAAGLAGGDAATNAGILWEVLTAREIGAGERLVAVAHAAAMTAALALTAARDQDETAWPTATAEAMTALRTGRAADVLWRWCTPSARRDQGRPAGWRPGGDA